MVNYQSNLQSAYQPVQKNVNSVATGNYYSIPNKKLDSISYNNPTNNFYQYPSTDYNSLAFNKNSIEDVGYHRL
jgi:hypothetical protein